MPDAAVITALYGAYDTLKPVVPQDGLDVDWVCVTDDPTFRGAALGWRIVYRPNPGIHPNRAAKWPKLHPELFTRAPASVWIDASFRVTSESFVRDVLAFADPIAQFVHPWRDCLYEEAEVSAGMPKYEGERIDEQAKEYRSTRHPEHWGLWAAGVIARQHTPEIIELGNVWAEEIEWWSFQDQVSQPFALRETGLRPTELPGTHFANDWLTYEGSESHES